MLVKDVMTPEVQVISPHATIKEVAALMKDLDVGPVPVCDGKQLLGIITDRDLAIRAIADGADPTTTRARAVMSTDVITVFADQDVREAADLMQQHQVRRLLVLDRDRQLAGIVSLGDLAVDGGDDRLSGKTLEEISEPATPA